jgi:hypothetical protein
MNKNKENGYVLIITLLSLVALTIAGMGAMMVASSDIQLSGNQRTQVATRSVSMLGVNAGMAALCSNSFLIASHYTGTSSGYLNSPASQPQAAFYQGIYGTPVPANTPGAGQYIIGYSAANSSTAPVPQSSSDLGSGNVVNTWFKGGGGGIGGGFYLVGPMMGLTGGSTKMECEQGVYYGAP